MATRWFPRRSSIAAGVIAALIPLAVAGQIVYRYLDADGRTVYSDRPPPANARDVEVRRLTPNTIEVDQAALAVERARASSPVTLYTFDCGEPCSRAETLLAQRGVPHATIVVTEADGAEKLKKLTGEMQAPVLQAGDKVARGFNEAQWQALLDAAGYPKVGSSRQASPEPPRPRAQSPAPPAGTGYPKD